MDKNKKYNIEEFYVGELYLYTNFANFISVSYNPQAKDQVRNFLQSGAINFQKDMESRYIDWDSGREYTGFLTIFYKQGDKYICLHDGKPYKLNGSNFIENLVPLSSLLPQINTQLLAEITVSKALQLFEILFKNTKDEINLYDETKEKIQDFYIGDIILKEIYHQESLPDSKYQYINLPHHIMLDISNLLVQRFSDSNYISPVYRCLFLRHDIDLYNINNNQFYNPHEDNFQMLITFQDYMKEFNIGIPQETISISKALKLFKKTT